MEQVTKDNIPLALQAARAYLEAGELRKAEKLCYEVIAINPKELSAIRVLATLAFHGKRPNVAFELLNRAISFDPRNPNLHVDLGNALLTCGQTEQAIASFQAAIALQPDHVPALNNLAVALQRVGQFEQAIVSLNQVVALRPELPDRHVALADLLRKVGRPLEAIEHYRTAVKIRPDDFDVLTKLGAALKESGNHIEAAEVLAKAATLRQDVPRAPENLEKTFADAVEHHRAERLHEAEMLYRQIIHAAPAHAEAWLMLGIMLGRAGRLHESVDCFKLAIAINPQDAKYHANLGEAYRVMEQLDLAAESLRRAIELRPDFAEPQYNLGLVYMETGRVEEAVICFEHVLALQPNHPHAASHRRYVLHFHPGYNSEKLLEELRIGAQKFGAPLKKHVPPRRNDQLAKRQLRIGYVSPDFRGHVVGWNMLPLFEHHDHTAFHVICYSNSQEKEEDKLTDLFRKYADQWRNIAQLSDEQVAQMITDDEIDILIDLALHTTGNRLPVFARKPAPIQVTFAGYPGTTGLSTIDYRLTDPYLDPPGMNDEFYSEQSIRLPHSFWCYAGMKEAPEITPLPALHNQHIIFGCLNNLLKISDVTWQLWSEVCRAVKDSHLLLRSPAGDHRRWYAQKLDLAPDRLIFVGPQPRTAYMQTYQRMDIGLDCFPYNGHTTSLDSLWMGVPVVTMCGQTVASRAGFSQASNLGLTELVAYNPKQFVEIAVKLANDLPRLSELRATLRPRMAASPLMDGPGFARDIENAYRQMWQRWIGTGS